MGLKPRRIRTFSLGMKTRALLLVTIAGFLNACAPTTDDLQTFEGSATPSEPAAPSGSATASSPSSSDRTNAPDAAKCAPGETACDGSCKDATSDRDHCGGCGVQCSAGEMCSSGQCATCPGVVTADGCEVSYDIGADDVAGMAGRCGGDLFNECKPGPLALEWKDTSGHAPKMVRIAMQTSVFCASGDDRLQTVSINGVENVVGSYEGAVEECRCPASGTERTFELDAASLATYRAGSTNAIQLTGPNRCAGMKPNKSWGGAVARVTVRY
jgi:hypothetical protein